MKILGNTPGSRFINPYAIIRDSLSDTLRYPMKSRF